LSFLQLLEASVTELLDSSAVVAGLNARVFVLQDLVEVENLPAVLLAAVELQIHQKVVVMLQVCLVSAKSAC
jgi:hypothetical protein